MGRDESLLSPYVASLATRWLADFPDAKSRVFEGTLEFVDISGFTRLTEMLAEQGKAGAEELTEYLDAIFAVLIDLAYERGAELVKWGGDAVLLWYSGDGHAARAVDAAWQMQRAMRRIGRVRTSVGRTILRMSVGLHSGEFHFFCVGTLHRELIVLGPAATRTAHLESVAEAGEVVFSPETAAQLDPAVVGGQKLDGYLLAGAPRVSVAPRVDGAGAAGFAAMCLPTVLSEFILAAPLESEHRQVSVGFIEYAGVDELLTSSGAEAVGRSLDEVFSVAQETCARHGVTFWETDIAEDGGKIMLIAGAPTAGEDDAGALLATAREIVDADTGLRLRAGVNCGRVFTGGFGPAYRRTYSAKGDAINLAARLMSRAAAGEVYASEAVVRRSRVGFVNEELEPFLVKGKQKPVHARRVFAARSGRRTSTGSSALVGREKEMLLLLDHLDRAASGRGSVVELAGPPGIGKSRLVEEVVSRAGSFKVVDLVCEEFDALTPHAFLGTLVREVLDIDANADETVRGSQLHNAVRRLTPDLVPLAPLLAPIIGAHLEPTRQTKSLDERFRPERVAETLVRLMRAAMVDPTLIVVDDSHWMDDASSSLFRRFAATPGVRPWLALLTRRPGQGGLDIDDLEDVQRLEVGPLEPEAVAQLLRSVTAERPLVPHLRDTITDRCGGNPLFLLELVGTGGQLGLDQAMPDSVEGVFAAQIDRLPPEERRILRVASVLGRHIDIHVLQQLAGSDLDISPMLGDFLVPHGEGLLSFRHSMLRDAAYEGLPYTRRRELHARAGRILEERAGADTAEIAGVLATHFQHAGQHQLAWEYARLAAARARDVHAPAEAAAFYRQALHAGRNVKGVSSADLLDAAEALGDAYTHLGQFTFADQTFRDARGWASSPIDIARLRFKRALATDRGGNYRQTLRLLSLADRCLTQADSPAVLRMRAEIRAQYGLVRHRQGRGRDAVRLLREAIERATVAGAADVLANTLVYLDIAELTAGIAADGEHARRALSIQRDLGDNPWLEARALNQLGIRAYFAGRWSEAVRYYSESRDACDRAGDRWTAAVESANIAEVLADQGHLAEAEPVLEEALETYRAAGTTTFVADGTRLLGRLAARRGDPELGRQLLGAARGLYELDGESLQVVLTDAILAESLLRAGEPEAAAELARRVLANASSLSGRHLVVPLAQRVLGVALRSMDDDSAQARRALAESIEVARRYNARYELALSLQAVSDLWPTDLTAEETGERDALFRELGIAAAARRLALS